MHRNKEKTSTGQQTFVLLKQGQEETK